MSRRWSGVAAVVLAMCWIVSTAWPAQAAKLGPRPNWGACGVFTDEHKKVYDFGSIELKCGGPKGSSSPTWGYRHILWREHETQRFGVLARAGGLNWSDLVHWAIYYNAKDPDHVVVTEGDGCRDRLLYLHDRNGRLVWQQRFKLIYSANDGRVISVYPTTAICKR